MNGVPRLPAQPWARRTHAPASRDTAFLPGARKTLHLASVSAATERELGPPAHLRQLAGCGLFLAAVLELQAGVVAREGSDVPAMTGTPKAAPSQVWGDLRFSLGRRCLGEPGLPEVTRASLLSLRPAGGVLPLLPGSRRAGDTSVTPGEVSPYPRPLPSLCPKKNFRSNPRRVT